MSDLEQEMNKIQKRLLADVDDAIELSGTVWKTKERAFDEIHAALNQATAQTLKVIEKNLVKHFESIDPNEQMPSESPKESAIQEIQKYFKQLEQDNE